MNSYVQPGYGYGSMAPAYGGVTSMSAGMPMGGVPGGQFVNSVQQGDNIVDQYVVPGETLHVPEPIQVPGVTTVMENQTYMEPNQVTVKVPRTVMEPYEISYQVPAYETRVHTAQRPKVVMEEQTITVNEPRTVMEPVAVQVPQVHTVQAVQVHHKVVEYERPRMIPGRYVRSYAGPTQTVGVTAAAPVATTGVATYGYAAPAVTSTAYGGYTAPVATGYSAPVASYGYGAGYGAAPMAGYAGPTQTVGVTAAAPVATYGYAAPAVTSTAYGGYTAPVASYGYGAGYGAAPMAGYGAAPLASMPYPGY